MHMHMNYSQVLTFALTIVDPEEITPNNVLCIAFSLLTSARLLRFQVSAFRLESTALLEAATNKYRNHF